VRELGAVQGDDQRIEGRQEVGAGGGERDEHDAAVVGGPAPLGEAEKVPATKVEGCASQVWLVPEVEGRGPEAVLQFRGER